MSTDQTTSTQRFYCPDCREWHETESLLEALKAEAEQIRIEQLNSSDRNLERGSGDDNNND